MYLYYSALTNVEPEQPKCRLANFLTFIKPFLDENQATPAVLFNGEYKFEPNTQNPLYY
jgi:hypothetical protein